MTESDKKNQRRRDILKAAAGVPAVFTLPTGAALATTSVTCVVKGNTLTTPSVVTTSPDTWIRFSVAAISFVRANGNRVFGFKISNGGSGHNYFKVNGTAIPQVNPHGTPTEQAVPGVTNYFLLVDSQDYSDAATETKYIFLGTNNVSGTSNIAQPIAGASCWNSVIASPGNIKSLTSNLIN